MDYNFKLEIGIFAGGSVSFTGETPTKRDLGGAEYCCVSMAEALTKLGHRVSVFTKDSREVYQNKPHIIYNGVHYFPMERTWRDINHATMWDVFIVSREYPILSNTTLNSKLTILWNHDILSDPDSFREHIHRADKIYCLSTYHKQQYLKKLTDEVTNKCTLKPEHISLTRNGVDVELIQQALRANAHRPDILNGKFKVPTFIYSSRPERGLKYLLRDIWPHILEKIPNAQLKVACYDVDQELLPDFVKQIHLECYELIRRNPASVQFLGSLRRLELFQMIAASHAYLYPSIFNEISCLSILEAQALGTPALTSERGALKESNWTDEHIIFDSLEVENGVYAGNRGKAVASWVADFLGHYWEDGEVAERYDIQKDTQDFYDWNRIAQEWEIRFYDHFYWRSTHKPKRIIQNLINNSDLLAADHILKQYWKIAADNPETTLTSEEHTNLKNQVDEYLEYHHAEPEVYSEKCGDEHENIYICPDRMKIALDLIEKKYGHEQPFTLLDIGCVVGSTKIDCPRDLQKYPDGIPIEDLVGKEFLTYSWSEDEKRFVTRKAWNVRKTGKKKEVWKLTWRDSTNQHRVDPIGELIATPDHKIMLSDGSYKRLDELKKGDSLVPLRRDYKRNAPYTRIMVSPGEYEHEHRLAYYGAHNRIDKGRGHVHHKDENTVNNHPSNLEWKTISAHRRHHALTNNPMNNPEYRAKLTGENNHMYLKRGEASNIYGDANPMKNPIHKKRYLQAMKEMREREGIKAKFKQCSGPDCDNKIYTAPSVTKKYCSRLCFQNHRRIYNHNVVSVEFYGYEDVYDMTVEDTHNYVANEIVIHNCGAGRFLYHVLKNFHNCQVMGIDFSWQLCAQARKNLTDAFPSIGEDVSFIQHCDILEINLDEFFGGKERADVVFCGEYLEHQVDLVPALTKVDACVKEGGLVIYTTPYGAWEAISFGDAYTKDGHEIRFHVSHFEHRDFEDMFKDINYNVEASYIQHSPLDASVIGNFIVSYEKKLKRFSVVNKEDGYIHEWTQPVQFYTPDYYRKFLTTRPYIRVGGLLIAKDEEDNITKALKPLKRRLDKILVYDTGSTDRTVELAEDHADMVVRGYWDNDFGAARNRALDIIRNCEEFDVDYVYWQDADEVALNLYKLRHYLQGDLEIYQGIIITQNHLMLDMAMTCDIPVRVFRNKPEYRFLGKIHEHTMDSRDPDGNTNLFPLYILPDVKIAHYGYVTEDERRWKAQHRNWDILKEDLKAYPNREMGKIFLMRDYIHHVRWNLEKKRPLTSKDVELLYDVIEKYQQFKEPNSQNHILARLFYQDALKILGEANYPGPDGRVPIHSALTLAAKRGSLPQEQFQPEMRWFKDAEEMNWYVARQLQKSQTFLNKKPRIFED